MTSTTANLCVRRCRNHYGSRALDSRTRVAVGRSAFLSLRGLAVLSMVLTTSLVTPVQAAEMADKRLVSADEITEGSVTPEEALLERMQAIGSVRIVMHSLEPVDRLADQIGSLLAALGVSQVEKRVVDAVPRSNQVRYYHTADREAGQAIGDALGLVFDEVAVRDFGDYHPVPSEGLIEVWLR